MMFLRKSKLKPMSEKRKAMMPERERCRRIVFKRDKYTCRAKLDGCTRDAWEVHELCPRSAGKKTGSITDPDNCVALCRHCHRVITANPAMAYRIGMKRSRYQKVQP